MFEDEVRTIDTIDPWPHQKRGVDRVITHLSEGAKRILLTSPTGGGKTLMMAKIAIAALAEDWGVTLYANRKMLVSQMVKSLNAYGIDHGVRAAGHDGNREQFQIASFQTEHSRSVKRQTQNLHVSGLVIVDEAHVNNNKMANRIIDKHLSDGAAVVGVTATPLGLNDRYDFLVQAGVNSELRECGALVAAKHHGCTEPDLRNIRRYNVGEDLSEPENVKAIMVPGIHGHVINHFRRLNPHGLPAIGFAPGVAESVFFAEQFEKEGIPAAHIDGDRIWIRGTEVASNERTRNDLLQMSRTGEVRIVWNRFVLREAIDMPWLRHGIFASVFGSLQSYLQSGGRLLRSCRDVGKRDVTVQDHGGNWHRHGSLNTDRNWRLFDTNNMLAGERQDAIAGNGEESGKEQEPFLCPNCAAVVLLRNRVIVGSRCRCTNCGFEFDWRRRSRPVIQANGELVEHTGNIFRARQVERRPDTFSKWKQMYFRARNSKSGMTFNQAVGLFFQKYGYYPPKSLPLMPKAGDQYHWYTAVSGVPFRDLRPEGDE